MSIVGGARRECSNKCAKRGTRPLKRGSSERQRACCAGSSRAGATGLEPATSGVTGRERPPTLLHQVTRKGPISCGALRKQWQVSSNHHGSPRLSRPILAPSGRRRLGQLHRTRFAGSLVRPSSSVAKKSDADFKISFARHSSRFSRSSSFSRSRSPELTPGRRPPPTSDRRTQIRNVSAVHPILAATDAHSLGPPSRARTARTTSTKAAVTTARTTPYSA